MQDCGSKFKKDCYMQHCMNPKSGRKISMEEKRAYYELYLLDVCFT